MPNNSNNSKNHPVSKAWTKHGKKSFLHQKRSSALLRYNDAIIVRAWTNNLNLEMGPGDTDSQQVAKDWEKLYKAKEKELNGKLTLC